MPDLPHVVANEMDSRGTAVNHDLTSRSQLTRSNTSSSEESYKPLPQGRWTLGLHGNCPRCHHHHKAVNVKVKICHDVNHVNHVHCERCNEKWAAFGGCNTTRISLLSSSTTEPDWMDEKVRYSLIGIVRSATAIAALGCIPELVPLGQSLASHPTSSLGTTPDISQPSIQAASGLRSDASGPPPRSSIRRNLDSKSTVPLDESGPHRLFTKAKEKRDTLLQRLGGESLRRWFLGSGQNGVSTRRSEKAPARDAPAGQLLVYPLHHSMLGTEPVLHGVQPSEQDTATLRAGLSRQTKDPDIFIRNLDSTPLSATGEHNHSQWIRQNYTEFKKQSTMTQPHLAFSSISGTSIEPIPCQSYSSEGTHRLSSDFFGIGGAAEGLGSSHNNTPTRRLSISDRAPSEASTIDSHAQHSDSGHLQRNRNRLTAHRPRSLPNARPSSPSIFQIRESRLSFDYRASSERNRSASVIIRPASITFSQATTARSSMSGAFDSSMSQTSLPARASQRYSTEVHLPLPSPSARPSENSTM